MFCAGVPKEGISITSPELEHGKAREFDDLLLRRLRPYRSYFLAEAGPCGGAAETYACPDGGSTALCPEGEGSASPPFQVLYPQTPYRPE